MSGTRAAIRYAKAILEIADSKGVAGDVNTDMTLIASTIDGNVELNIFIQSPIIKVEQKENALLEVFATTNAVTKSLFHLLFENKRFEILQAIALEYIKLFDIMNGVQIAKARWPIVYFFLLRRGQPRPIPKNRGGCRAGCAGRCAGGDAPQRWRGSPYRA